MSLWHDNRGVIIRGIAHPGTIFARYVKWQPRLQDDSITTTMGPCPDEINVALASLKPLILPNEHHTLWVKSTTGSWYKHPEVPIWITMQSVPDMAAWAEQTKDLKWIGRWMNPKSHKPREYMPVGAGQTDMIYAKDLKDRWQGIPI